MKAIVLCLIFAARLLAQNAALSGVIKDPADAAVPRATVRVVNDEMGTRRTTLTNENGLYSVPSLIPGIYRVIVEAAGFQTTSHENVKLEVADNVRLDIRLEVGKVDQSIKVEGRSDTVNTTDAAVSTVVSREFVENLPLNGRSFHSLIELAPGVVTVAANESSRGTYSVNGQRPNSNNFTVDGMSINLGLGASQSLGQGGTGSNIGTSVVGGANNLVSIDALQEFRVMTSTFAPEYGRTPGGQVAVVTRSGTNQYHGALFEYFRNDKFDANDWFLNRVGTARPPERQNDFGGVFGGPVIKNRTFFFVSYEGLRLRQPAAGVTDVPSLALRQTAPAAVQPYLKAFPLPTGPDGANGLAPAFAGVNNISTLDATSVRIDHMVNGVQLFGRFDMGPSNGSQRGSGRALNSLTIYNARTWTMTAGAVAILSPKVTNDFRFNVSRSEGNSYSAMDDFGGAVPLTDSLAYRPGYNAENSSFGLRISSGVNASIFTGLGVRTTSKQYAFLDSISMVKGAHQMRFGVDWRRLHSYFNLPSFVVTAIMTDTNAAKAGTTGGVAGMYAPAQLVFPGSWSAFAQDTWKVGSRLTLTYGLRWEVNPPPNGGSGNSLLAVTNPGNLSNLALESPSTPIYSTRYKSFAPRFGVAYQLSESPRWATVIRTGFGLFYDTDYGAAAFLVGNGPAAFSSLLTLPSTTPFPVPLSVVPAPFTTTPPFTNFIGFAPNLQLPGTWQWNFSVEQSLGGAQSLTVSYVGAAGRNLFISERFANLNSSFLGGTTLGTNNSTSDYEALQAQFQRRFSHGFQALVSYGWSHAIDTNSSDTTSVIHPSDFYPNMNRGSANFDIRQSVVAALVYQIPTPKFAGAAGRAILGGWELDPILRARTAPPVDVTGSRNITGVSSVNSRVNLIPGQPFYINDPSVPGGRKFNVAAFAVPPVAAGFVQGTFGRNVLRAFNYSQLDISVDRTFKLTERVSMQFRSEFFNITNHPNFGPPPGNCCSATFGISSSMLGRSLNGATPGGFNTLYQIGGPRSIQFALRLRF